MIRLPFLIFIVCSYSCYGQSLDKLTLQGDYNSFDSVQMVNAYLKAKEAVDHMHRAMDQIWNVNESATTKSTRKERWESNETFVKWLGKAEKIGMAHRRIKKIHARYSKKITLEVIKENRGRCTGWISAWAIPFGKIKIRLCEDFFIYRTHLQEKVLVHEMGHEVGMLSHHKIHGCRAAIRAAANRNNAAKRSPENYAWLAMSFMGLECNY